MQPHLLGSGAQIVVDVICPVQIGLRHRMYEQLHDFEQVRRFADLFALLVEQLLPPASVRNHPDQRVRDLDRNLASLSSGHIEYLVTRHIPQQSFQALTAFAECVIKGVRPPRRNNYVHMDILHRRNLDDY